VILTFATDGLLRGQPFFLPALLILVPLAGAVLSGMGLWEVQNSEGTRAGANLAKWGLALSLVFGIGYYVYQNVTGLASFSRPTAFAERTSTPGSSPSCKATQPMSTELSCSLSLRTNASAFDRKTLRTWSAWTCPMKRCPRAW
jgi:hypothetical protein